MKVLLLTTIGMYLFFGLLLAQDKKPFIISPLIGEKLDRVERDYFKLFSHFDEFWEAVFYLNSDSSLSAEVKFVRNNETVDTTIQNYKTTANLRRYISLLIAGSTNDIEDAKKGNFADISAKDSSVITGELIEVKDISLVVYNPNYKAETKDDLDIYGFNRIQFNDIAEVKITDRFNIATYLYPIAGSFIGYYTFLGLVKDELTLNTLSSGFWFAIGGATLLAYIGKIFSVMFPLEIQSETLFESPFDKDEIEGLRDNARNIDQVPYFILNENK